jgi:D-aspartate ligase
MLDGQAPYALVVARCLVRAPGVCLHVLSLTDRTPVRYARWLSTFELMPGLPDDAARLELVRNVVQRRGIDVILASSEDAIGFVSANRGELEKICAAVSTPGTKELDIAWDKGLFSSFMAQNGMPYPPTCLVTRGPGFDLAVKALPLPLLLKPVKTFGGVGMIRFSDHKSLIAHLSEARLPEKQFIVQSLVQGEDGGCNVLCRDGKVLVSTVQRGVVHSADPYGAPSCVEIVRDDEIVAQIARLMKSLNWSGVANIDYKLHEPDHSLTVLEVNPRYWGSLFASLFAGVNFPYLACVEAMGLPLPEIEFRPVRFTWNKRKLLAGLLAPKSTEPVEARGSVLRFMLPDPLPELVEYGRRVLRR